MLTILMSLSGCASTQHYALSSQPCVEDAIRKQAGEGLALALRDFRSSCNNALAHACSTLGVMYEVGVGVRQDSTLAARLFQRGCDAGNPAACTNLAAAHLSGSGAAKDTSYAVGLLQYGCDGGDLRGCIKLGTLLARGIGMPADPQGAARLLHRHCVEHYLPACVALADLHAAAVIGPAPSLMRKLYEKACLGGLRDGCDALARNFHADPSPHALVDTTSHPLQVVCEAGDAAACAELALALRVGDGIPSDLRRSALLFQHACEEGHPASCALVEASNWQAAEALSHTCQLAG